MADVSKAVVTVLGFDRKGIIAAVSDALYKHDVNILDISQTVLDGYFNMILIADVGAETCDFDTLKTALEELSERIKVQIHIQRSEIFEAMHQI